MIRGRFQREIEHGSTIGLAFGPDAPTVTRDDARHGGETNPSAAVTVECMQAAEGLEDATRLAAAYELYLRFPHPRSTAIASQVIVMLFAWAVVMTLWGLTSGY